MVIDPHVGGCVKIMQVTKGSCCVLFQLFNAYCAWLWNNNCSSSRAPDYTFGSSFNGCTAQTGKRLPYCLGPWEGPPHGCLVILPCSLLKPSSLIRHNWQNWCTVISKPISLSYLKAIEKLPSLKSASENRYIVFNDQRHTSKRMKENSKKARTDSLWGKFCCIMCVMFRSLDPPNIEDDAVSQQIVWCCGEHKTAVLDVLVTFGWLNHQNICNILLQAMLSNCIWQSFSGLKQEA